MSKHQQQDWILNYQQNPTPNALGMIASLIFLKNYSFTFRKNPFKMAPLGCIQSPSFIA
jgi:hypothetical protein